MIVSIPVSGDQIYGHFGHSKLFKQFTIENNEIVSVKLLMATGEGHVAMHDLFEKNPTDIIICDHIGRPAVEHISTLGIDFYCGVSGSVKDALEKFINGTLEKGSPASMCGCNGHHH